MIHEAAAETVAAILSHEMQALGALVDGDVRAGGALLNEAARLVDTLLGGAGRERLRYRPKSTGECMKFVFEMVPLQAEALRLFAAADAEAALLRLHGHASVLWRLAGYLHDAAATPTADDAPLLPAGHDDETREALIVALDDLLEGAFTTVEVGAEGHEASVRFYRRGEHLMLDAPIAALDADARRRALAFFVRLGGEYRGWDDVSLADETFAFTLEMGLNLDRAARIALGALRDVVRTPAPVTLRTTV